MNPPSPTPSPTRHLWWWVLAAALLLALRKPWALHTPQLWAEDGSIFLAQDDQFGLAAFLMPYNGYLHFLPRFIAWFARSTLDVAWWPACYNGFAYATHVAVLARLASARVQLPAKPGLLLAIALVAGTGEVLLNVTNLQWLAAFFLVLHLFTAAPTTVAQRLGDAAILVAVGLNGPFALVFTPLFAWRAWHERRLDDFLSLALVAACAAVQGALLLRAGPTLYGAAEPLRPLMYCSVLGSRLVLWPFFGPAAVQASATWIHALAGGVALAAILGWALRPDPRRPVRALLVATFCLVTAACTYRVRADLWSDDNLVNGDRYFFLSRVLLMWLVVLEWDAVPRAVAWLARGLCVAGLGLNAPAHLIPAPPDYEWAKHCDPIRRGTPANIKTLPEGWWIEYPGRPGKR